ncbi:MAG: 30S ribosomal protein S4 [Lentisphaerae bacterium]|jgi:small subunit ribosomal protein S4|nr:30S ribosomal protein S4 [Lentisphaerota bacterium]
MADAAKKPSVKGAKHTLCRRVGQCLWGMPNCPTNTKVRKSADGTETSSSPRAYPAGQHGPTRRRGKLSTYGELLLEKQKLRKFYDLTEHQLRFIYESSKRGEGITGDKLLRNLEMRLMTVVYRSGLASTIFAARQVVSHRHVLVDGKIVDRASYRLKPGQVVTINAERSPKIAEIAKVSDAVIPPYLEKDKDTCKVTIVHEPLPEEIPLNVEITKVIEYYAR